jgi:hypothetical protein
MALLGKLIADEKLAFVDPASAGLHLISPVDILQV